MMFKHTFFAALAFVVLATAPEPANSKFIRGNVKEIAYIDDVVLEDVVLDDVVPCGWDSRCPTEAYNLGYWAVAHFGDPNDCKECVESVKGIDDPDLTECINNEYLCAGGKRQVIEYLNCGLELGLRCPEEAYNLGHWAVVHGGDPNDCQECVEMVKDINDPDLTECINHKFKCAGGKRQAIEYLICGADLDLDVPLTEEQEIP